MAWFNKKQSEHKPDPISTGVQIVTHKNSTHEVVRQAKEANDKLNQLLAENHFTVKIFLAAGGKTAPKTKRAKK